MRQWRQQPCPPQQWWPPPPQPFPRIPPIVGVTDGSTAAPGEVGEVLTVTVAGTLSSSDGWDDQQESLTLPPGDWDVWFNLIMTDIGPGNFNEISGYLIDQAGNITQASVYGSFGGGFGLGGGSLASAAACISTAQPMLLTSNVSVIVTGADTATYSFITTARRRR